MKTDLQKYELVTVKRSQLHEHPKNPRVISESAKKKLKEKMRQVGLLQPPIVNKRSDGRLVILGGHQRIGVMDSLNRYQNGKNDYELDVALVEIDEQAELEMLVFLNNPSASGTWDTDLLAEINQDLGIDFGDMGFDKIDVDLLFDGDARFSELFADNVEVDETKNALAEIKEHRKESTAHLKEENKADFYAVIVCRDQTEKDNLMAVLHLPKYETMISADTVLSAVKG